MVHGRCATIVGMDDIAAPDEAEILGTAVTASPLAADAPVRIPVHRYISAGFAELEYERVWHVACTSPASPTCSCQQRSVASST